ncbi:MAG: hypothetical protein GY804_11495 [Alphaproteobacteria bacterium]|nr:hypothetical protein [Alphaproteobacteria bacterium]
MFNNFILFENSKIAVDTSEVEGFRLLTFPSRDEGLEDIARRGLEFNMKSGKNIKVYNDQDIDNFIENFMPKEDDNE